MQGFLRMQNPSEKEVMLLNWKKKNKPQLTSVAVTIRYHFLYNLKAHSHAFSRWRIKWAGLSFF